MIHPLISELNNLSKLENNDDKYQSFFKYVTENNILYKKQGELSIFKYNKLAKHGSELQRFSRGVIINMKEKKILCSSIDGDISYNCFKESVPIEYCVIEENIEGTMLNVYYYNNRWNVSTKFCINADESKFRTSKSFRQILDSHIDIYKLKLDKNYTYSFVLSNSELDNKTSLYHIETTNNITGEKINIKIADESIIKKPKILYYYNNKNNILKLNNYNQLNQYLLDLNWNIKGYMLYSYDRKYRCSLINNSYLKVKKLLDNQHDINYICFDSFYYKNNMNEILKYYPEFKKNYTYINNLFKKLLNLTETIYVNTKCKKKNISIPIFLERSIRHIHQIYKQNYNSKITKEDIKSYFLNKNPSLVYSLLLHIQ